MYSFKYDPDNMFECPDFFKLDDYPEHFLKLSTMPPHRDYFVYGSYELNSATGKYDFVADPSAPSPGPTSGLTTPPSPSTTPS
eukprot:gene5574-biopygen3407